MRWLPLPLTAFAAAAALFAAASCLGEIEENLPAPTSPAASTFQGACEGACCPSAPECYPNGDPEASGAECLAMRDNTGQEKITLATVWRRSLAPEATRADTTYAFLYSHSTLDMPQCNMRGQSGFIQLLEWTRRRPDGTELPIGEQTLKTGFAAWVPKGSDVLADGLCFLDFDHTDPPWRDRMVHVGATTTRRVANDFDAKVPAFRDSMKGKPEGVFYADPSRGYTHGYGDSGWVVIFETEDNVMAIPIHEVETTGTANDPASFNCIGRYRGDALDPNTSCGQMGQMNPPYGCVDESCPVGEGPSSTTGYFLIEELEEVHNSILNMTLCVNYMGMAQALDEGWADPAQWGLNCRGSPKWKAGERPRGDWCAATNSEATADCADAWRSIATGAAVAMPVREGTCSTTAQ